MPLTINERLELARYADYYVEVVDYQDSATLKLFDPTSGLVGVHANLPPRYKGERWTEVILDMLKFEPGSVEVARVIDEAMSGANRLGKGGKKTLLNLAAEAVKEGLPRVYSLDEYSVLYLCARPDVHEIFMRKIIDQL